MKPCKSCDASLPATHTDQQAQANFPFVCRRHAPEPRIDSGAVLGNPYTWWTFVDGEGCCDWIPKKDEPKPEEPASEES